MSRKKLTREIKQKIHKLWKQKEPIREIAKETNLPPYLVAYVIRREKDKSSEH